MSNKTVLTISFPEYVRNLCGVEDFAAKVHKDFVEQLKSARVWGSGAFDGQVVSREIIEYLNAVDVKEIHGYEPEIGLQLFTEEALKNLQP